MSYQVKEIYYTLQGEGANTGRAAVFCRFAGCNLWSGREEDRSTALCQFCDTDFVGTDGPGGGHFESADALADAVARAWPEELRIADCGLRIEAEGSPGVSPAALRGAMRQTEPPPESAAQTGTRLGAADQRERFGSGGAQARQRSRPLVVCTGGEPLLQLDRNAVAAFHCAGFEIAVESNGTKLPPEGIDWICVSPKAGAPLVLTHGDELKLVYPQAGAEPERFVHLDFLHFFLQPMDGPEREKNTELAVRYCLEHPQWRLSLQTHKYLGLK